MNGREWLRRSLEKAGIDFVARRNKFVHVDDYARAQRLLDFADGLHPTDGVRVRHWVDANSVNGYNELNVFRAEMTMNQPGMFRVHRHTQGQPSTGPKRLLPLRKGVADIALRAEVSQEVNNRFLDNLATAQRDTPVRNLLQLGIEPWQIQRCHLYRAAGPMSKHFVLQIALKNQTLKRYGFLTPSDFAAT
jgi:hypothetical protein